MPERLDADPNYAWEERRPNLAAQRLAAEAHRNFEGFMLREFGPKDEEKSARKSSRIGK
jgi:hypothetical protein